MKRFCLSLLLCVFLITSLGGAFMFSEAHANRAVMFFENLKHTKGKFRGKPFILLPWEKEIVRDVYGTLKEDGTRQYKFVYIEVPKKNGKSEIAAGAGLYHLVADGEMMGEVYGCAAERSQASIVFDVAADMIEQVPALAKRAKLTESKKRIKDRVSGSFYQVLSAEAYSKHGLNVSACIIDELHAHANRGLYDVMTFGAGDARTQPIWWIITTSGDDPDRESIGWEVHEYATKVLSGEIIDPTWYVKIYTYDGDDIYNEDNWNKANPSLGVTISIESVREAANRAKNNPAEERLFRWLRLNQWITTKLTTWLPLNLFDATVGEWNPMDMAGMDCFMGLDLSTTTDLSSVCMLFPPQGKMHDWRTFWHCWIPEENMQERIDKDRLDYAKYAKGGWVIPTPGNVIDYTMIEEKILELARLYNVIEVDADKAFATMLLQRLEAAGMTCVDIPQTFVSMTDPLNQIQVLLNGKAPAKDEFVTVGEPLLMGRLTHEYNPVARWAFGNASIAKNGSGLIKLVKEHKGKSVDRTKRIDPMVALACAMARARYYKGTIDLNAAVESGDFGF